jgi:hypothetical protein
MKISPGEIRDIERLQKYERIFQKLLKNEYNKNFVSIKERRG